MPSWGPQGWGAGVGVGLRVGGEETEAGAARACHRALRQCPPPGRTPSDVRVVVSTVTGRRQPQGGNVRGPRGSRSHEAGQAANDRARRPSRPGSCDSRCVRRRVCGPKRPLPELHSENLAARGGKTPPCTRPGASDNVTCGSMRDGHSRQHRM